MKCQSCLADNPADTSFCGKCGLRLDTGALKPLSFTQTIPDQAVLFAKGNLIARKYRIAEQVGRGGMGIVYKAEDIILRRPVALKFLSPDLLGDPDHQARFLREAQMASALNHPHICTIYEIGDEGGTPFIAMEYVRGRALNEIVRSEPIPAPDIIKNGIQITGALEYAHDQGIIHRDLKTANVMITREGQTKILDFGLAKRLVSEKLVEASQSQKSITEAGSFLGTMYYASPEAFRGEPIDARSDIWALGVMFYEMAAGRLPFDGRTGFELSSSILRDPPAPLPSFISSGLSSIIMKSLEKEAVKRFQNAGEVRTALEGLPIEHVASPTASRKKKILGQRGLRKTILLSTAVAAVLIALTVIPKRGLPPSVLENRTSLSTGGRNSSIPEANEYFEKGMMFLMHQFDLTRAREMLEKSLERDPKFAEARAWYGFTFLLEIDSGYSNDSNFLYRAEEELKRALQDEPDTARAHSSLAGLYFYQGRKDLMIAEAEKALSLNSLDIDAKIWMGNYYLSIGDNMSARALLNQMLEEDPLFFPARMTLGDLLRTEGEHNAAIKEQEKILEQDPHNSYALQKISLVYIDMNELSQARQRLEGLAPSERPNYDLNLTWALLLAREGKTNEALKKMDEETLKFAALAVWSTSAAAEFYAQIGDSESALDWLERAVRNGDERDDWFRRDPLMESLHDLPRFKKILDSISFRRQQKIEKDGVAP